MTLLKTDLLKNSNYPEALQPLLTQAEEVLRTWQSTWSPFVSAPLREEALRIMAPLNEIQWKSDGGHPGAERRMLQCSRTEFESNISNEPAPIKGLQIEGNFLFDKASSNDFRKALEDIGAPPGELGDIWVLGDRGAQALCSLEASAALQGSRGFIRHVEIHCESLAIEDLQLPAQRISRKLTTVEASTRLDAIASAGFGLSRAKVVKQIKNGLLRLNWMPIKQSSRGLVVGDQVQLEGKGSLEVVKLELTKRQRWRIELLRQ